MKQIQTSQILSTLFVLCVVAMIGCNSGDPYLPTAPKSLSIVGVTPLENQQNVATNTSVTVVFESDLNPGSLNRSTMILSDTRGTTIPGSVTYDEASKTAVFRPIIPLQSGTRYQFSVDQVKGSQGELIAPHSFFFQTVDEFVTTRLNPRENTSGIKVTGLGKQEIFAQFNQSVNATVLTTANFYAYERANNSFEFDRLMDSSLVYDENLKKLTLKPATGRLKFGTTYNVTLKDVSSTLNGRIGIVNWSFTTDDIRVSASIPSQDSLNVSTGTDVSILFQAPVNRETVSGNVKLRKAFGTQQEFFFKGEPTFSEGDTRVTFRTKIGAGDIGLDNRSSYEILVEGVRTTQSEVFKTFRATFQTE